MRDTLYARITRWTETRHVYTIEYYDGPREHE